MTKSLFAAFPNNLGNLPPPVPAGGVCLWWHPFSDSGQGLE